ncbi:hypothetical protein BDW75DRAFT_63520 [Aspergillus navahoensis]
MLRLFCSVSIKDIALVLDTFKRFPMLPRSTTVFVTGLDAHSEETSSELEAVVLSGAQVGRRRIEAQDLDRHLQMCGIFCGSPVLKDSVSNWLACKKVVYDDFNY